MTLPELRRDRIRREWVVINPKRRERPSTERNPQKKKACPFCPENEDILIARNSDGSPMILYERKDHEGNWLVRAVPNGFPPLRIEGNIQITDHIFSRQDAVGASEIIIEGRDHKRPVHQMSLVDVSNITEAAIARYFDLKKDSRFKYFHYFRNCGKAAGASLEHPHSQLYALSYIPPESYNFLEHFRHSSERHNYCPMCALIEDEEKDGSRVILTNDFFVVLAVAAPFYPKEIWIVSRRTGERHSSSFAYFLRDVPGALNAFSEIQIEILQRLNKIIPNLAYNLVIYTAPYASDNRTGAFHWFAMIRPRITIEAGAETVGIRIIPDLPEETARVLRGAK